MTDKDYKTAQEEYTALAWERKPTESPPPRTIGDMFSYDICDTLALNYPPDNAPFTREEGLIMRKNAHLGDLAAESFKKPEPTEKEQDARLVSLNIAYRSIENQTLDEALAGREENNTRELEEDIRREKIAARLAKHEAERDQKQTKTRKR